MSELHPDKHRSKSQSEQASHTHETHLDASDITRAYDVIKNSHSRALHLLELNDETVDEHDSANLVGNSFLLQIMEIREQAEDANTDDKIKPLIEENNSRIEETNQRLSDAFSQRDYEKAKRLTAELRYWDRIDETLREKIHTVD